MERRRPQKPPPFQMSLLGVDPVVRQAAIAARSIFQREKLQLVEDRVMWWNNRRERVVNRRVDEAIVRLRYQILSCETDLAAMLGKIRKRVEVLIALIEKMKQSPSQGTAAEQQEEQCKGGHEPTPSDEKKEEDVEIVASRKTCTTVSIVHETGEGMATSIAKDLFALELEAVDRDWEEYEEHAVKQAIYKATTSLKGKLSVLQAVVGVAKAVFELLEPTPSSHAGTEKLIRQAFDEATHPDIRMALALGCLATVKRKGSPWLWKAKCQGVCFHTCFACEWDEYTKEYGNKTTEYGTWKVVVDDHCEVGLCLERVKKGNLTSCEFTLPPFDRDKKKERPVVKRVQHFTKEEDDAIREANPAHKDFVGWETLAEEPLFKGNGRSAKALKSHFEVLTKPNTKKKNYFTDEEDAVLSKLTPGIGFGWTELARQEPFKKNGRTGKVLRKHYIDCLDPKVNRGEFTPADEDLFAKGCLKYGKKWTLISREMFNGERSALQLQGRFHALSKKWTRMGVQFEPND